MNKLFLGIASMIVTHFLLKVYDKISKKPPTKEEVYLAMKKAERERIRARGAKTMAELEAVSTPRDGEKWMASIGTVQQMRDALRPSNDQCDAMAMAPGRFA